MSKANSETLDNQNVSEMDLESTVSKPLIDRIWFDDTHYWLEDEKGDRWQRFNLKSLQTYLKGKGKRFYLTSEEYKEGFSLHPGDELINEVNLKERIAWAGPLGGRRAGVYRMAGQLVLVTESPKLIEPQEPDKADDSIPRLNYGLMPYSRPSDDVVGECIGWPMLAQFWRNLFTCFRPPNKKTDQVGEDYDQLVTWYGCLQQRLKCIYNDTDMMSHGVLISGEPGCGKSLTIWILQELLGGRIARPMAWMIGNTPFNSSMFKAPLLVIDDDGYQTRIIDRKCLAAKFKQVVAVGGGRMEAKGRDDLELKPYWWLIYATNTEEQNLLVFPPLDEDIRGKVLIFKGYSGPWPWGDGVNRDLLQKLLKKELPYFLHWILNEFKLPKEFQAQGLDTRYAVKDWLHPEITEKIHSLSREVQLWTFIERTVLSDANANCWDEEPLPAGEWKGSASELDAALRDPENRLTHRERGNLPNGPNKIGESLKSLMIMPRYKDLVFYKRTSHGRLYHLFTEDARQRHMESGRQRELTEAGKD